MLWTAFLIIAGGLHAEPPATPLWLRGHAVVPTPRKVTLGAGDVVFDESWSYRADGLAPSHIAIRSLTGDLRSFHHLSLGSAAKQKTVRLAVSKGATGLKAQGYSLEVKQGAVSIAGNSDAGLLYGVQTFLQLLKPGPRGMLLLPEVSIEDWPALELRFLHWDTKHHQDRMETLKRYLDWAVRFKVNRIGFELEDKFAYPSLPDIGAPGAFTAAELQEIVNYGLERHIEVVPVIQAPAHLAYVLKHPQYAHLKADGNNYQVDLCNEESYQLIFRL
ncbi:MAG: family 20 glycosylhydrolase, partial [Bryobacterales bacterium]|nr:family 20 glycosylhydrolase [Bryobacterales bacterium]